MEAERLEDRLCKLEGKLARAERRYRLALAGVGTVVLACAVIWVVIGTAGRARAQKPSESGKVIRANRFVLEDDDGKTCAMMIADYRGAGL